MNEWLKWHLEGARNALRMINGVDHLTEREEKILLAGFSAGIVSTYPHKRWNKKKKKEAV